MQLANICRFGNQDVFRLLGRDPISEPLTSLELALFERALYIIVDAEYSPKDDGEYKEVSEIDGPIEDELPV